jgi:hypothetical protein
MRFSLFDIAINLNDKQRFYLDYEQFQIYAQRGAMFYAEPLLIGDYQKCINYNPSFQTTIPKRLGLPAIPDNPAEGVVVRLFKSPAGKQPQRLLVKIKAERFSEFAATSGNKNKFNSKESQFEFDAKTVVNANRLAAVMSKIGRLSKANASKAIAALKTDALEALAQKYPKPPAQLLDAVTRLATQLVNDSAKK